MTGRVRWSPSRMSEIEAAVTNRRRVVLARRGTEFVVVATALRTGGPSDVLVGRLPITGETLEFRLADLDEFHVLGS